MENYLIKFKKKHGFSDEDCKRYSSTDIMFDIDTDIPSDALEQWDEYKKKNGYISFVKWTGIDNGYTPRNIDKSSLEDLKSELNNIYKEMENSFSKLFNVFYDDIEDSDSFPDDIDEE